LELLKDLLPQVGGAASPRLPQLPGLDPQRRFVTREFLDLAIMASKVAYESEDVQRFIVTKKWEVVFGFLQTAKIRSNLAKPGKQDLS
jgi:hypothetical protein